MSQVAIILSDLPAAAADIPPDSLTSVPALAQMGRYGQVASSPGWRPWLASWLGRPDLAMLAGLSPAVVAAAAIAEVSAADTPAAPGSVWMASPVQLTAGLRSVHMPADGLLRLSGQAATELVEHFNASFGELGFWLQGLPGGGFLAQGPSFDSLPVTTDPARLLGADLAGSTPQGPEAAPLLRLGAELEMWLHAHPMNAARARLRQPPISTLWLWGGGPRQTVAADNTAAGTVVFGEDACAAGLCALSGAQYLGRAAEARAILEAARHHDRVAVIIHLLRIDPASPGPISLQQLLQQFDSKLLTPVLGALGSGNLTRVSLLANDSVTTVNKRDPLKFWRRSRGPLVVLR